MKRRTNGKVQEDSSLVRRIADQIRRDALACAQGELVGSEDDLVERFGVSHPTFRQAAKIVEQEQLLRVKRGVGGGYFSDRPDSAVVSHMTAIYLHTHNASLRHIMAAVRPLFVSTARIAAQTLTPDLAERLSNFADSERSILSERMSTLDYVRSDKAFTLLFAETSGNPLIRLFIDIVLDLTSMVGESVWKGHPDRIVVARQLRLRLIDAILARDVDFAEIAAKRLTEQAAEWTLEMADGSMKVAMPPPPDRLTRSLNPSYAKIETRSFQTDLPAEWIPSEYACPNQIFYKSVHRYRHVKGDHPALEGVTYDGERHLLPLFNLHGVAPDVLEGILEDRACFYPVTQDVAQSLQAQGFRVDHMEADSDYVYQADRFKAYPGRALHPKRNLLHQFERQCTPWSADLAGHEESARAVLSGWLSDVGRTAADTDHDPCLQAIAGRLALGMMGRIAFTGSDEPAGFLIGSRLGTDCAVIHFAKGRRAMNGVYPFLFSDFARRSSDIRWLNFEQDLGNPRFRQTKRSFAPHHMITKYRVRPRPLR